MGLACTGIMREEEAASLLSYIYTAQESRKQRCPRLVVMELVRSSSSSALLCAG